MKIAIVLIACIGLVACATFGPTPSKNCLITNAIQRLEGYIDQRVQNHVAQSYDPKGQILHGILKGIYNDGLFIQAQYSHFEGLWKNQNYNRVSLAIDILDVLRPKVRNGFGIVSITNPNDNDPDLTVSRAIRELDGAFINKDDSSGNLFLALLVQLSDEGFVSINQRNGALTQYLGNKDAYVTARGVINNLRRSRVNNFCNAGSTATGAAGSSNGQSAIKALKNYVNNGGNNDPHGDILRGILNELDAADVIGTNFKDAFVSLSRGIYAGKYLGRLAKLVLSYVERDQDIRRIEEFIDKAQGDKNYDPKGQNLWSSIDDFRRKGSVSEELYGAIKKASQAFKQDRLRLANFVFERLFSLLRDESGIELS